MSMLAIPFRALLVAVAILTVSLPAQAAGGDWRRRTDIWVKYDDVPRRVRETFERERGRHPIKQVIEIRYEGKVYFRALIDERGTDRAILVSEGGRVVKVTEIPDVAVGEGSFERLVRYEELP